jgi:hypothetical protein
VVRIRVVASKRILPDWSNSKIDFLPSDWSNRRGMVIECGMTRDLVGLEAQCEGVRQQHDAQEMEFVQYARTDGSA